MKRLHLITFLLASCSILYELLIAHTVSSLTGITVTWYSLTIGLFLASMGFGSLYISRKLEKIDAKKYLARIEIFLSLIGGLAPFVLSFVHLTAVFYISQTNDTNGVLILTLASIATICSVGFLSGIELPLLIAWGNELKEKTNRVLAVDYLGSLVGAVSFSLLVLPYLGEFNSAIAIASINLCVAIYLIFKVYNSRKLTKVFSLAILPLFVLLAYRSADIEQFFLKRFYYFDQVPDNFAQIFQPMNQVPEVERYRSKYQTIDLVKLPDDKETDLIRRAYSTKYERKENFPSGYGLFINSAIQVHSDYEEIYHEFFAHVPILQARLLPEKVLVLGGGDGLLVRELLKHQSITSITLVDFDPVIIDLARTHPVLRAINEDSLGNPRVNVQVGDAFHFVRETEEKFDAIYLDFPFPNNFNVSRVYSKEFYSKTRELLRPAGFVAMIANGTNYLALPDSYGKQEILENNLWPEYYSTIKKAGFDNVIPFFSNFERFTPPAYKAVLDSGIFNFTEDISFDDKAVIINHYLREYILEMQVGYIMMYDGDKERQTEYFPESIQLDVLNQLRFKSAMRPILTEPDTIDPEMVNSIERPTLRSFYPFAIKVPFT